MSKKIHLNRNRIRNPFENLFSPQRHRVHRGKFFYPVRRRRPDKKISAKSTVFQRFREGPFGLSVSLPVPVNLRPTNPKNPSCSVPSVPLCPLCLCGEIFFYFFSTSKTIWHSSHDLPAKGACMCALKNFGSFDACGS